MPKTIMADPTYVPKHAKPVTLRDEVDEFDITSHVVMQLASRKDLDDIAPGDLVRVARATLQATGALR